MGNKGSNGVRGIRIGLLNYIIIIVAWVLYAILIYESVNISVKYQSLITTTQDYITSEKDATLLDTASDYLTEQVRLYVMNMDVTYAKAYFTELNVDKRREQALDDLQKYHQEDDIYDALQNALDESNELAQTEIYAMKLVSVAKNYSEDSLPEELKTVELKEEDLALSSEEMIEKARTMVFDSDYQISKETIDSYISQVVTPILEQTQEKQLSSAEELKKAVTYDRIWLSIFLITNIITFIVITVFVVKPLRSYVRDIKNQKLIDVTGAYEFQYLASTYNNIYQRNAAHEAILRKKAERDALTGLLNRGAFDQICLLLEDSEKPMALLIVDVDQFKSVNDGYGHDVGDQILKKIARTLLKSFRTSDYVARFGGDEFAVIVSDITVQQQSVIQKKIDKMNMFLLNPQDGLPAVSLSIGIAFSPSGYSKEVFNQADSALYQVKENGRCGCKFYVEE
jgi:diguanylate cyclase (GGDEF)-like protein